jgi:hypothetical protein
MSFCVIVDVGCLVISLLSQNIGECSAFKLYQPPHITHSPKVLQYDYVVTIQLIRVTYYTLIVAPRADSFIVLHRVCVTTPFMFWGNTIPYPFQDLV